MKILINPILFRSILSSTMNRTEEKLCLIINNARDSVSALSDTVSGAIWIQNNTNTNDSLLLQQQKGIYDNKQQSIVAF